MGAAKTGGQPRNTRRKRRHEKRLRGKPYPPSRWRQDQATCAAQLWASLCPAEHAGNKAACRLRIGQGPAWTGQQGFTSGKLSASSSEALQKLHENFLSQGSGVKGWSGQVMGGKGKGAKRRFGQQEVPGRAHKKTLMRLEKPRGWAEGEPLVECWVGRGVDQGKRACLWVDKLGVGGGRAVSAFEDGVRSSGMLMETERGEARVERSCQSQLGQDQSLGKDGDRQWARGSDVDEKSGGCVGFVDGVDSCTAGEKGCSGSWLDSLPDMVPGTLLSSDDECDTVPCPPSDVCQGNVTDFHAATVSANLTMTQTAVPKNILPGKPIVFLWDLDETLILATSLNTGRYAQHNRDLDEKKLGELGANWLKASNYISEKHLYSKQIRNEDRASVSDLLGFDDGRSLADYDFTCDLTSNGFSDEDGLRKLAYRYRKITEFYKLGLERSNVSKYVPFWQDLWKKTDSCCKNWLSSVQNLLEATLASDQDVVHVIVTAGYLVPSLTKLMLFQMDTYFDVHNVFSSHPLPDGKFDVFRAVRDRFGPNATYCAVGDGPYEELAAAENGWPFVRISLSSDSLPTVGLSGGVDALGRLASTPMDLTADDMIKAAHAEVPIRARAEVPLSFKESTRKKTARAAAGKAAR